MSNRMDIRQPNINFPAYVIPFPTEYTRMPFLKTFFVSANNEGRFYLSEIMKKHTYDHTLTLSKKSYDLERSTFKVTPRIHLFSKVLIYLKY